jgi:hypothetical protein
MRTNRRRNRLIKRIAFGLAVAAVAAPVAQARVDEGTQSQPNAANESFKPIPYRWPSSADQVVLKAIAYRSFSSPSIVTATDVSFPRAMPSDYALARADQIELVRSQHRSTGGNIVASDYGMPRAMPVDYALASGDQIEVVRAQPRATSSDKIEFVRTQPRSTSPELVDGRYAPNERQSPLAGREHASWNVNWDDAGIGAGFALVLVLLGGGAALVTRQKGRVQTA